MTTNEEFEKIQKRYKNERIPRGKAIKLYCKEMCCAGDERSWTKCTFKACFLWNFRLGNEIPKENKNE